MRLAVLTVSPHTSYWNFVVPITPATTGPELMPMRNVKGPPSADSSISRARAAATSAWSSRATGTPAAAM